MNVGNYYYVNIYSYQKKIIVPPSAVSVSEIGKVFCKIDMKIPNHVVSYFKIEIRGKSILPLRQSAVIIDSAFSCDI